MIACATHSTTTVIATSSTTDSSTTNNTKQDSSCTSLSLPLLVLITVSQLVLLTAVLRLRCGATL
jgi:hypothetical protein